MSEFEIAVVLISVPGIIGRETLAGYGGTFLCCADFAFAPGIEAG